MFTVCFQFAVTDEWRREARRWEEAPKQSPERFSGNPSHERCCVYLGFRHALTSSDVSGQRARVCSVQEHCLLMNLFSMQLSEKGLEPGFRLEGLCQMKSAASGPDSTGRSLSRLACRMWGPEKPRLICKCKKGYLPLEFPAVRTNGPKLYSKCILRSSGLGVGPQTWTSCLSSQLHILPADRAAYTVGWRGS